MFQNGTPVKGDQVWTTSINSCNRRDTFTVGQALEKLTIEQGLSFGYDYDVVQDKAGKANLPCLFSINSCMLTFKNPNDIKP